MAIFKGKISDKLYMVIYGRKVSCCVAYTAFKKPFSFASLNLLHDSTDYEEQPEWKGLYLLYSL